MKTVWGAVLKSIPLDDIKAALETCPDHYPEWPPTVGQFKELCMIGKDPILIPPERQIEKPRDHDLAMSSFAEMRRILGVK
jgi:hypothetical protein